MSDDHFQQIYAHQASKYDAMVSREDYQGNILKSLKMLAPLSGADVVEMGAGTGRLTRLLAPLVNSIRAYDNAPHMLHTARKVLEGRGIFNVTLQHADNRSLPTESESADLAIAGWSFGHAVGWYGTNWQRHIHQMMDEMLRVVKPGGVAVIFETMGTGTDQPAPPSTGLAAYYQWLEQEREFRYQWIRTDYAFASVQEADDLTRFFFGDVLADRIVLEQMKILPECTGIWWKTV